VLALIPVLALGPSGCSRGTEPPETPTAARPQAAAQALAPLASLVRLQNARLRRASNDGADEAVVSFDLVNESGGALTELVLAISIVDDAFTVRGAFVLEPSNSLTYEMRFRNVASRCECSPVIEVQSARPVS
jgi:hypothetical protein